MYGCESGTIKKADHWRIDLFELWCWSVLLRVPWTARRSNQSILKEISPVCSLEGLLLKLKLQYFGHLMQRADSLEKTLRLGKIEGRRRRGRQRMRWLDALLTQWTWVWLDSGSWWWTGRPGVLWFMGSQSVRYYWAAELNWGVVATYFINFCLPDKVFISSSFLKNNFTGFSILGWWFFPSIFKCFTPFSSLRDFWQ